MLKWNGLLLDYVFDLLNILLLYILNILLLYIFWYIWCNLNLMFVL